MAEIAPISMQSQDDGRGEGLHMDVEEEEDNNEPQSLPIIEEIEDVQAESMQEAALPQFRGEECDMGRHLDVENNNESQSLPLIEEVEDIPLESMQVEVASPLGMMQHAAIIMQQMSSNANVTFNFNVSNVQHIQEQKCKFYGIP